MLEIAKLDLAAIKSNSLMLIKPKERELRCNLWMMQMNIHKKGLKIMPMKMSPLQRRTLNQSKEEVWLQEIRSKNRLSKQTANSTLLRVILHPSNTKINRNSRNY